MKKYTPILSYNIEEKKPRQKILSKDEVDEIVIQYQQGATIYKLADLYGCHRQTISRHLKKNGVEMRDGRFTQNKTLNI